MMIERRKVNVFLNGTGGRIYSVDLASGERVVSVTSEQIGPTGGGGGTWNPTIVYSAWVVKE